MRPPSPQRDFLLQSMALQLSLISDDQLSSATAFLANGNLTLGAVLVQQGALGVEECTLLERLVDLHLARNSNDGDQSILTFQPDAAESAANSLLTLTPSFVLPPTHSTGGSSPDASKPGESRFQKIRFHEHGGLGEVHLARDRELGREVALKEIRGEYADRPDFRARFVREAEITGRLEHPGIVPIYGLGSYSDGRPFYAMRFIHGQTMLSALDEYHALENRPASEKNRRLRQLLGSFIEVCNTLAYAHSRGVVHRDMKPANVMLGPFGETIVVDWGIGKILGEKTSTRADQPAVVQSAGSPELTGYGMIGTPAYMSPEQAMDSSLVTPASDIYSLGATLYHLLVGNHPLESTATHSPRPRDICPTIPVVLEAICLVAMAPRPADRYASARDLAADVQNWLADEPTTAHVDSFVERVGRFTRKHRAWTRAGAMALVLVAFVGIAASILIQNARGRESRAYRVNLLSRDFAAGVENFQWDDLPTLDRTLSSWESLDEFAGATNRDRLHRAMVSALDEELGLPNLEPEDRVRIEARLSELEQRAPSLAAPLRGRLDGRVNDWQRVFRVAAPYTGLDRTFDAKLIRIDQRGLTLADAPPMPHLATRLRSGNNVRFRAVFDEWESVAAVGLLLDHTPTQRYQFIVTVTRYKDHDDDIVRLPKLGQQVAAGEAVRVWILRNGVALRQTTMHITRGPLELFVRRQGGRLSFQVNKRETLGFEDPFALTSKEQSGVFGIYWPHGARLQLLEADSQSLPSHPSSMEKADALLAAGRPAEALLLYEREAATARPGAHNQEARFKMARCLEDLNRVVEAEKLWEGLNEELPPLPRADQPRWSAYATCKLWLAYLQKVKDAPSVEDQQNYRLRAEDLLARLSPAYTLRELAPIVPAGLRENILDSFRIRGPIFSSAYLHTDHIAKLERAVRVEDLFDESAPERRLTRWRLMAAYRANQKYLEAIRTGEILLDDKKWPNVSHEEKMAMWKEFLWTLREAGQSERALREVNQLLRTVASSAVAYRFLLVERARIHASAKNYVPAQKDIEAFFAIARKEDFDYTEYADACLVRAMIRSDLKDPQGARDALLLGLPRTWPGGLPSPPQDRQLSIRGSLNRANGITFSAQIGSSLGQLSDVEAEILYRQLVGGTGFKNRALQTLIDRNIPRGLLRQIILGTYDDPRGQEITRRMTYRTLPFVSYFVDPLYLTLASACRVGAYTGGLPADIEPILWKGVRDIHAHHETGKIGADEMMILANLIGTESDPRRGWPKLAPKLDPELRLSVCHLFAFRCLALNKLQSARPLLQEVIDKAPPGSPLARSAREQLAKLNQSSP